jgi:hypothetical protein
MRDAQNPTLIAAEVRILCPPDMMNVSFAPEGDMVIKGGVRTFAALCIEVCCKGRNHCLMSSVQMKYLANISAVSGLRKHSEGPTRIWR